MKKNYIGLGLLIVVVGIIGFVVYSSWSNNSLSYITISINPEVQLAIDSKDEVVEVISLNEDADILTSDLDLEGLTVEEATGKLIDSAMETGFLDEYNDDNTVVVTTINDNEKIRQDLEEKVMDRLNSHFESRKIYPILVAKGLNDDLKAEADEYDISYGKMLLVESALALNETLSKDDLVNMEIRDIQSEIKDYVKERRATLNESLQDARVEWQEQKDELKKTHEASIEQLRTAIAEEYKEEFNNMTADQRKEAVENYLNARKEAIKSDVGTVREEIKAEVREDMKGYNYPIIENNTNAIKESIKEHIEQKRANR